jgi:hypothetical protein
MLMVKGNHPVLCRKIAALLSSGSLFETRVRQAVLHAAKRRGRIETRTIAVACSTATDLARYTGFTGACQVFSLHRCFLYRKTGVFWEQTILGITSLSSKQKSLCIRCHLCRG